MVVPDRLYEKELEGYNGSYLRTLGLGVVALTPEELSLAQEIKTKRTGLSLPDCFALSCATRPDHVLVTGDKILRIEAQARIGKVYGLLGLLDQMAASGKVSMTHLHEGLTRISGHPRCRLPRNEINFRLSKWAIDG